MWWNRPELFMILYECRIWSSLHFALFFISSNKTEMPFNDLKARDGFEYYWFHFYEIVVEIYTLTALTLCPNWRIEWLLLSHLLWCDRKAQRKGSVINIVGARHWIGCTERAAECQSRLTKKITNFSHFASIGEWSANRT